LHDRAAPPCWQLAIRAFSFNLGEDLSRQAQQNLQAALDWAPAWLQSK